MCTKEKFFLFAVIFLVATSAVYAETGFTLTGKVTDTAGHPLAGATVALSGTLKGVQTGIDGSYLISDLKTGEYSIRFSFIGYGTETRNISFTGDTKLDAELNQTSVVTDEVIISSTRAGTRTPLAYSNVGGEFINKRNSAQDIPYLLGLTPSLVETSEAGNGVGYTGMRIRGTEGSRINVTIDGIPLNDPESQQVFWVDLPDLAASVDNIQVQRGVGTSSNGAGAFGASINIQSKGIENEPFAEINSSAGSFATFKNSITAGTGLIKGRFAVQMRYSDLKSDGYIERTGSNHRSAFITGLYRTEKSLLKANIILGQEHTGIGWWGVPREMLSINRRYNPAGEYTDDNGVIQHYGNESDNYSQDHFQLIYSRRLPWNLSFHTAFHYTMGKGYYEEYKEDNSLAEYGVHPVPIGDTTFLTSDLIRRKWMSNDFYGLIYSLNYKSDKLETTIGGGINVYSGDHFGRIIWMRYPGSVERDYQWYFSTGEKDEASIYGKASYLLTNKLTLFGDIQYRHIQYNIYGIDDDLKDISQRHRFGFFNPKAGLFYNINPDEKAFISFSVANREPTRTDFIEAAGDRKATPAPERLYDSELGYSVKAEKSSFSVNLYGMFYKDQLVPTGELSNVGYSIMTNAPKSYRAGVEFTAGYLPADFINWDISVTFSRNKIIGFTEHYVDYNTSDWSSEYKSRALGNTDIAYSPSLTGSSDVSFKLSERVRLHLISKYVGKQYFDNTMNSDRMLNPYFVNNIMAGFEPKIKNVRGVDFQILVNNILNKKYESNAYGGNWFENGLEKTWAYYFPQAGINFLVKLGLKF